MDSLINHINYLRVFNNMIQNKFYWVKIITCKKKQFETSKEIPDSRIESSSWLKKKKK